MTTRNRGKRTHQEEGGEEEEEEEGEGGPYNKRGKNSSAGPSMYGPHYPFHGAHFARGMLHGGSAFVPAGSALGPHGYAPQQQQAISTRPLNVVAQREYQDPYGGMRVPPTVAYGGYQPFSSRGGLEGSALMCQPYSLVSFGGGMYSMPMGGGLYGGSFGPQPGGYMPYLGAPGWGGGADMSGAGVHPPSYGPPQGRGRAWGQQGGQLEWGERESGARYHLPPPIRPPSDLGEDPGPLERHEREEGGGGGAGAMPALHSGEPRWAGLLPQPVCAAGWSTRNSSSTALDEDAVLSVEGEGRGPYPPPIRIVPSHPAYYPTGGDGRAGPGHASAITPSVMAGAADLAHQRVDAFGPRPVEGAPNGRGASLSGILAAVGPTWRVAAVTTTALPLGEHLDRVGLPRSNTNCPSPLGETPRAMEAASLLAHARTDGVW
jgi:hypothetical protein